MTGKRRIVAVDVDGVLATYNGWEGVERIGVPILGAVEFTKRLGLEYGVVIHSCRGNLDLNGPLGLAVLQAWLDRHGFHYDEVWCGTGKPLASAYVDDRAVPCRPNHQGEFLAGIQFDEALTSIKALSCRLPNGG